MGRFPSSKEPELLDLDMLEGFKKELEREAQFAFGSPQLKNLLLYLVREIDNLRRLISEGLLIQDELEEKFKEIKYYEKNSKGKDSADEKTRIRAQLAENLMKREKGRLEKDDQGYIFKLIGISNSLNNIMNEYTRLLLAAMQHVVAVQGHLNGIEYEFSVEKKIEKVKSYLRKMSGILDRLGHRRIFSYRESEIAPLELAELIAEDQRIVNDEKKIEAEIEAMQKRLRKEKFLPSASGKSLYQELTDDLVWLHEQFETKQKGISEALNKLKKGEDINNNKVKLNTELSELSAVVERLESNLLKLKQTVDHFYKVIEAIENTLVVKIKKGITVSVDAYIRRNRYIIFTMKEEIKIENPYIAELKDLSYHGFRL